MAPLARWYAYNVPPFEKTGESIELRYLIRQVIRRSQLTEVITEAITEAITEDITEAITEAITEDITFTLGRGPPCLVRAA
jgi:hypothetical protein